MKLQSLHIYPVKSCRGLSLKEMKVGARGPEWDREWMIVDEVGQFLTQRQLPRLALVETRINRDSLSLHNEGHGSVHIPLELTAARLQKTAKAVVWSDACDVVDEGDGVAEWLSTFLSRKARLVRMTPQFQRRLKDKYGFPESHTGFADSLPFLLTSTASLSELNSRLSEPVTMDRFRANLVIDGKAPYAEDSWERVKIGEIELDVSKPCTRCTVITINQTTASGGKEPLKTLATYRKVDGGIAFGQNLIHFNQGYLRVGDAVEVII